MDINVKIGAIYEHYKGKRYKIIGLARYSENPEQFYVIYQGLYNCDTFGPNPIWTRPLQMFLENIIVNDKEQPRFKYINI